MKLEPLSASDKELLTNAIETADRLYVENRHEVAATIRTSSGQLFSAIHIEGGGGTGVCGEVAAICCMVASGHRDLDTVCAVWRSADGRHVLLPPCGNCREMIRDFNPRAWVILTESVKHWEANALEEAGKLRVSDLLPRPWR